MPQIDDISRAVGAIEGRQESLEERVTDNHTMTQAKLDRILDGITAATDSAKMAHVRLDTLIGENGPIVRLQRSANDYSRLKRRGILAVCGLALTGGTAGDAIRSTGIVKALLAVFGH